MKKQTGLAEVPVPATIVVEGGAPITCMFRPSQLTIEKRANWAAPQASGEKKGATQKRNVPVVHFGGGEARTFALNLLFDTTDSGSDVRKSHTDNLFKLTEIAQGKEQPPLCKFVWGNLQLFRAYVTSVKVTFKMFLADGTPVRAEASVTFNEFEDENKPAGQNPTSYTEASKTWIVTEGDRLDLIAYHEYGNAAYWRHIAKTNNLMNPTDLQPGQILKLVPLPE